MIFLQKNFLLFLTLIFMSFSCTVRNKKEIQTQEKSFEILSQEIKNKTKEVLATHDELKIKSLASEWYLKGSALQIEGDYILSNVFFEELLKLTPQDNYVEKKLAISLIRAGQVEKAESHLERVYHSEKNKDTQLALLLSGVYTTNGKNGKAKEIYSSLISGKRVNQDACIFLSKIYSQEGNQKSSISTLETCARKEPKSGVYHYYIGKTYLEKKDLIKAKHYFEESLKREKDFPQAVLAMGLIHEEKQENKKAIKLYQDFLKRNEDNTVILKRLVQLMFTEERFQEVIPYAEKLSDIESDDLNLKVKLGILYTDAKDYKNAISTFKLILNEVPESDKILYYLGAIYQETKEFEHSIETFSKIPETSGLFHDSAIQIATMLSSMAQNDYIVKRDNFEKSKNKLLSYVSSKKEMEGLSLDLALVQANFYESLNMNNLAIDSIVQFESHDKFSTKHRYYLGSLYEKEKNFEKSFKIMNSILDKEPSNAHAWNFIGYSLVERGENLELAHEYLTKALKFAPNDGYIKDSMGWYYFKIGKIEESLRELKEAFKTIPEDASVQKHLAIVYTKLKNFSEAKKYFVKALSSTQDEEEILEIKNYLYDVENLRMPASLQSQND